MSSEQPMDWADNLALDIIAMVHGRSLNDARRIIAMELRFLKVKSATRARASHWSLSVKAAREQRGDE